MMSNLEYVNKETIAVINGPNINILGIRETNIYGTETWNTIEKNIKFLAKNLNMELIFYQSNVEGYIVNFIQEHFHKIDGIIINPAAYTKNGYAILDALTSINIPYVEVHLSNISSRGDWHSKSIFTQNGIGMVTGFKGYVYELGLLAVKDYFSKVKGEI